MSSFALARLHQLNEFECVTKAFVYLAAHLPRDEVLEPVMNESFEHIVNTVKNIVTAAKDSKAFECFFGADVDVNCLEAAIGQSSSNAAAVGIPLSEAEPDMFPCLVIICGSAFAFLRVSRFGYNVDWYLAFASYFLISAQLNCIIIF